MSKLVLDFQVPSTYDKSGMADIIRTICTQLNILSEGKISARYASMASVPSGSAVPYAKGDIVWDSNPTVRGSVAPGLAAAYVRTGWICTADGSPGTWQEMRELTGT